MVDQSNTGLVDHRGRPIRRATLAKEPQTANVGHLAREFGDHPSRGLTPAKLSRILNDAERGDLTAQARLGEDMEEKDAHLFAELSKRRGQLLGLDWDLQPPVDATPAEQKDTARIEAIIRDLDWEDIINDAAAAILHGYSCQEIVWDRSGGEWRPQAVEYRQPDWFMMQPEGRNELLLRTLDGLGEPLRPWGWIVHEHKAKSGYLARGGLARILAWPYLFRNYSARDFAEFLEIHGLPMRIGKYPAGANDTEKATLMKAVVGIGHAAAGVIPQGMDIDFEEAAKGSSDPFMAMMHWAEQSMSKAILGGTLTSQTSESGGGAYALGEVHNEVRHDIARSDARQIARTLSRHLVEPLVRLNTTMQRLPQFQFDTGQAEDMGRYSEALPKLVTVMDIPARWAHDKLRIPMPEGDEPLLRVPEKAPSPSPWGQARANLPAHTAALTTQPLDDPDDLPAQWAERLQTEGADAMAGLMEPVRQLLQSVSSLEEFRDRLVDLYDDMPEEQLARIIHLATSAAELAGRDQIQEEG
ncbi:DUF935 domain-containing protein [Natronospirillum operosum]|uniref:DUF935 domain-containing protein n=1 Tax=Natronospirillum operosum TaxID=2759953 RepID=A0A4Z0WED6_9GAMM|nr:DUF935 domain-containing protein [Natronospirillum operosum]TGG92521.1 DUF935 domain-containing protein [Natronospirillum operosum]